MFFKLTSYSAPIVASSSTVNLMVRSSIFDVSVTSSPEEEYHCNCRSASGTHSKVEPHAAEAELPSVPLSAMQVNPSGTTILNAKAVMVSGCCR